LIILTAPGFDNSELDRNPGKLGQNITFLKTWLTSSIFAVQPPSSDNLHLLSIKAPSSHGWKCTAKSFFQATGTCVQSELIMKFFSC